MDWVRYSKKTLQEVHHPSALKFCMLLDFSIEIEDVVGAGSLCKDAILNVCGLGMSTCFLTVMKAIKNNTPLPCYRAIRKTPNNCF